MKVASGVPKGDTAKKEENMRLYKELVDNGDISFFHSACGVFFPPLSTTDKFHLTTVLGGNLNHKREHVLLSPTSLWKKGEVVMMEVNGVGEATRVVVECMCVVARSKGCG